ncbi:MAG: hypothetical protein HQ519_00920 [Planctomycetes bacterium]|nr:hypothetical protein [Planctomycetota bacterium]
MKSRILLWPAFALAAGLPTSALTAQQSEAEKLIEVRANTYTRSTQHDASLDIAPDGRTLVAWGSRRQEVGSYGIFAQLFDPLGRAIGTELHVNHYMPGGQLEPSVTFAADGSAWVAWCSYGEQDGQSGGIFMRQMANQSETGVFDAIGSDQLVNQSIAGDQVDPAITALPSGQLVVTWLSAHAGRSMAYARLFDASGQAIGDEFRLSQAEAGVEAMPCVAALSDGFVTAWARTQADGKTPAGVFGRRFNAAGKAVAGEMVLSSSTGNQAIEPSLDSNGSDQFAVAWMSLNDGMEYQVNARLFSVDGSALGSTWVSPLADEGYCNGATVAMAKDGAYSVLFNQNGAMTFDERGKPITPISVYRQDFAANGELQGELVCATDGDGAKRNMQVGLNSRHAVRGDFGQLAYTWNGSIADDKNAVGLTVHAPAHLDLPAPPLVEPVAALQDVTRADIESQIAPPEWDPNWVDDSNNFEGGTRAATGFRAFTSTGWTPPDPDLAVGPNHIVAVVNVDMRYFDKDGNQQFNTGLESFFGTNGFVFDPVALYDPHAGRFVIAAAEHNNGDYFNIAVSDDSDPNGAWHKYRFNVSSLCGFIDFENLGCSTDAYFVVADCFSGYANYIHVMDKTPMLSGGAVSVTSILAKTTLLSNAATKNFDDGTGYFASAWTLGSPKLKLYAVEDPAGAATLHKVNVDVGAWGSPPGAVQLGSSNRVATIDTRIKNGVVRDGYLYLCHNVGHSGVCQVRWYKINLNGWPTSGSNPTLADSGYVDAGSGVYTWFGDINVDADGNMAIAYNQSSSAQYVGVNSAWRAPGDAAGTLKDHLELQISTSAETGSRWGDYSGLENDPSVPGRFWSHHEYRTTSWRTWAGKFDTAGGISYDLALTLNGPLVGGSQASATVSNSTQGSVAYLFNGSGHGSSTIPGLGVDLQINNALQVAQKAVNVWGFATINKNLPPGLAGLTVYLQAADSNALLSPVVVDTIQ